jgi:hypothetical protein
MMYIYVLHTPLVPRSDTSLPLPYIYGPSPDVLMLVVVVQACLGRWRRTAS